ncbi:MAG TPA: GNAT family N-acetyltransferase [Acidimicrobiales bacterium]|nr:GNAT family N-acetyltransferase [Acidimicrobiales bacterium]
MVVLIRGPLDSVEEIDRLEPLWLSLHAHHLAVASYRELVADQAESWRRRRDWYVALLAAADGSYFLAEEGTEPVGYMFLRLLSGPDDTFDAPRGMLEVLSLLVRPENQGEGIGARLLDSAEAEARRRGVTMLEVAVMAGNDRAASFYRRAGFSPGELVLYRSLGDGGS